MSFDVRALCHRENQHLTTRMSERAVRQRNSRDLNEREDETAHRHQDRAVPRHRRFHPRRQILLCVAEQLGRVPVLRADHHSKEEQWRDDDRQELTGERELRARRLHRVESIAVHLHLFLLRQAI